MEFWDILDLMDHNLKNCIHKSSLRVLKLESQLIQYFYFILWRTTTGDKAPPSLIKGAPLRSTSPNHYKFAPFFNICNPWFLECYPHCWKWTIRFQVKTPNFFLRNILILYSKYQKLPPTEFLINPFQKNCRNQVHF